MLIEIRSDKLRTGHITFHNGLNVILGDDNATNSIGKSSLLMVIDFVFGGNTFVERNKDVVQELGHHDYYFAFLFDDETYRFRRGTDTADTIYRCDAEYDVVGPITLEEYTTFLKAAYQIAIDDITFRSLVGLYLRVWGKENLDVHRPLHMFSSQPNRECVNNLIKTFGRYGSIKDLAERLRAKEQEASALRAAFRNEIVPQITSRQHKDNQDKIAQMQREIEDIKQNLAKYATNIAEVVNREILELKVAKDELLATKLKLESRLSRVQRNIAGNRHIRSRHFAALTQFFPDIDQTRLANIEEFHSVVARLLRTELEATAKDLQAQIERVAIELQEIDGKMASTLVAIDKPTHVVDRVYALATSLRNARLANQHYETEEGLERTISSVRQGLSKEKAVVLGYIQSAINDGIRRIVAMVFGPNRKSPALQLSEYSYAYDVFEDTGTGTAYANLIVFDLAIFGATVLPVVAHDSVLFKNIENDSVANLFRIYSAIEKQSFVAIDEIDKYGPDTASMLRSKSVIQLDDDHVLYIKDWRAKLA
jgi:hypothetical protein